MTILEVLEKRVKETELQEWRKELEYWNSNTNIENHSDILVFIKKELKKSDLNGYEKIGDEFKICELYNDYFPQHLQDVVENIYTEGNYRYFTIAICLPLAEDLYLTFKVKNKTTINEESIAILKEIYVM